MLELERELCRLPEISAARVVVDPSGRPTEVHILADTAKHAKQVVRDVQSVALASFGIELDRRIVSVVQLGSTANGNGHTEAVEEAGLGVPAGARQQHRRGQRAAVARPGHAGPRRRRSRRVRRRIDRDPRARHRLVATATVDALRQLETAAECIDVDSAQIVRVGAHDVAIVTVVFVLPPSEQLVSGSAIVRQHAEAETVVRAVLDATNRRLPSLV